MATSGTYAWAPSNSDLVVEAFARAQIRPAEIEANYMAEATRSLNLELHVWGTRGVNLWAVNEGVVINLVAPSGQVGVGTYVLPANLLQILNVRYNQPITGGGTTDRIMLPIGREDYAAYPNKLQPGIPTVYWFQRLLPPQLTIWQPDANGPPNTITYDALMMLQDAYPTSGQTPNTPDRFWDALGAKLAHRLFVKFWTDLVRNKKMTEQGAMLWLKTLKDDAEEAWQIAALDDQETAPLIMDPDLSDYYSPR